MRKIKADILHFHLPFPLSVMSYFFAKPEGKIVISWHSDIVRQKISKFFYHPFLVRFLKKADVIIATSPNMVESSPYLKRFRGKCRIIPLGIDVERFKLKEDEEGRVKEIRERYTSGKGIILFVGRLIYYKGVEYLIRAMRDIDASCLIIGEGKLKKKLEKMVDELGLSSKVHFLGSISDDKLPSYYHACDVFCLPSVARSEAFGIVQLEAMVCGKPIVSTNLPTGVPFVNQDKKTGIVVPPKNPQALAEAINTLLENPALRKKYGGCAKERVEKEFTKKVMVKRLLEVYREVVKR
ncbi:glycosyltransferase [Candidatus Aerophobetes bacterium]|nr:glycosyltransferase [Candidatus Aerophobetes bacterium]